TAILCGSDVMAAGALEGVRSQGLSVPRDVSVAGYDDVFWAALTNPPLTTVRQAVGSIARAAVRTALGGGEDSRRPARTEVLVRRWLLVRGSRAAPPAGAASTVWCPHRTTPAPATTRPSIAATASGPRSGPTPRGCACSPATAPPAHCTSATTSARCATACA